MIRFAAFVLLFFGSCIYALSKGSTHLRIAGAALLVAGLASGMLGYRLPAGAGAFDTPVFIIDLLLLAVLLGIVVRSERYWPIYMAGLQASAVSGHLVTLLVPNIGNWVYWFLTSVWAYPIHLVLIGATYRHVRRNRSTG